MQDNRMISSYHLLDNTYGQQSREVFRNYKIVKTMSLIIQTNLVDMEATVFFPGTRYLS